MAGSRASGQCAGRRPRVGELVERRRTGGRLALLAVVALAITTAGCQRPFERGLASTARSLASNHSHGVFVAANCAPVAAARNGTMVWYSRDGAGVWNAYIGSGRCRGKPLLPAYD